MVKSHVAMLSEPFGWQTNSDHGRGRVLKMAKCERCGKTTTFGHNRSFSLRATNRTFRPNLQQVSVFENGRKVRKVLCTKCIRTIVKSV